MTLTVQTPCTAFAGHRRLAAGPLADVALAVKAALEETAAAQHGSVLTFDDTTGRVVDIDTRGSRDDVLARLARAHAAMEAASADAASADAASPDTGRAETASANLAGTGAASRQGRRASLASSDAGGTPRGRGRPRLGVIAREVTLLPRHWEWLNAQPGGASVALRKLVEAGMRDRGSRERARREAAYRFMSAMAGDMPGFEEATRALFAADTHAMAGHMAAWPDDIREHALRLAFAEQEH
ncbi:DUF2239 family protein [Bordetella bronchialis]|uniref:DUF2239 domain-containing protein n=1 Tax=Bordetella bronchialis TaxID=463025 RepID=A0A193G2C8_9BORD|nr:DUF2239 family protein [Bordetella bronchialis]ANN73601.1 hypothetical protein BAU08_21605 [Bordetella bronchialis]